MSDLSPPEQLRRRLLEEMEAVEGAIASPDLRTRTRSLIPANHLLRKLGKAMMPTHSAASAKARILQYLRLHVGAVIDGDELMVVSGISEYARRVRELRVQDGWPIISGMTGRDIREDLAQGQLSLGDLPPVMRPDQYLLEEDRRDEDAARRWKLANSIRKSAAGVQDKLLTYFRANVGAPITSEELRYVAGNSSEWARRTRELRTEEGWPIVTKFTGDPDLPMGVYVLAENKQAPVHDRHIPEITRREVMRRDQWSCRWRGCGWSTEQQSFDPRFLEVHHIEQHAHGGSNEAENLVTLCNLHHDEVHRSGTLLLED